MRRKTIILAMVLLLGLSAAGWALAQVSASYDLSWNVISGGGGSMSSASYSLEGSIGQPALGTSSSTSYRLDAGFWAGIWEWFSLYLPAVLKGQ